MSKKIQQMFANISQGYDLANDILSFGIHRRWKKKAIQFTSITPGQTVLDVCCGTGDLSFLLAQAVGKNGSVTGIDFVKEMIDIACKKQKNLYPQLSFIQGDALNLPFANNSVDLITIAFGIRNVDNIINCLTEFRRVLKPEGKLLVLEFGQPKIPLFSQFYRFYSKYLMPQIGGLVTGDKQAYQYLPESAKVFPCGKDFEKLLSEVGFSENITRALTGGIAFLYLTKKTTSALGAKYGQF